MELIGNGEIFDIEFNSDGGLSISPDGPYALGTLNDTFVSELKLVKT